MAAAPLGSTTRRAWRASHATAAAICASDTVTNSSTNFCACAKVMSPGRTGIRPSAMVAVESSVTWVPRLDRSLHLRGAFGLDRHHATGGPALLDGRRHAGQQAAAAHRDEHRADIGTLLEDLEARRALPRHNPRVIERRHHRQAARRGFPLGAGLAIVRRLPLEDDLGAIALGAVDLHLRCGGGHDDHGRRAERARRERHRLPVIARGIRDDPPSQLIGRELRQHVERAADLEGAHRLEVLAFQEERAGNREPGTGNRAGHLEQRGDPRSVTDAHARGLRCRQRQRVCPLKFSFWRRLTLARELIAGVVRRHLRQRGDAPAQLARAPACPRTAPLKSQTGRTRRWAGGSRCRCRPPASSADPRRVAR